MTVTTKEHSKVVLGSRHAIHNFEYADAAARTGAVGLTVDNNFQIARQIDTGTYWILTDYSGPTWLEISTGGAIVWQRTGTVLHPLTTGDTVKAGNGAVGAPTYAFENAITSGLYLASVSPPSLGVVVGGTLEGTWRSTGLEIANNLEIGDDLTFTAGGTIKSTANGDVSVVPNGTGVFMCGTGSPVRLTPTSGEAYFAGDVEMADTLWARGALICENAIRCNDNVEYRFGTSSDSRLDWSTGCTNNCLVWGLGNTSRVLILCDSDDRTTNWLTADYSNPTLRIQSNDGSETEDYSILQWNNIEIGGGKGSYCGLKSVTEEITVAVGQGGFGGGVDSSANLIPGNSRIEQVMSRVTQAPGGGATTIDIGRTNGGNLDEYADDTAVTLGTTTNADDDGDGNTTMPHWQTSADTITIGTNAAVTGSDMKVRIVVFYREYTVPAS